VDDSLAAIADRVIPGARLRGARRLTGGVSADVHALDLAPPGAGPRTIVVRRLRGHARTTPADASVAREFALLTAAYRAGIPVPEPLAAGAGPGAFLAMAFADGTTEIPPDRLEARIAVMARTLADIHALSTEDLPALPSRMDPRPEVFDFLTADRRELADWLAARADTACHDPPRLLHGDFWPGNLLWVDDRLNAVLDWEDAAIGDPLSDVACTMLELTYPFGARAASAFAAAYRQYAVLDDRRLPLWQVYVASAACRYMGDWGLPAARERHMRACAEAFVDSAAGVLMAEGTAS
jgi:aminoglycoside phosphotransferase (APT) family kinase protein